MLFAPALLLATGAVAARPDSAWRAAEAARRRVVTACHIAADRLVVSSDGDPSVDTVTLTGSDPLPDAQLLCLGEKTAGGTPYVAFAFADQRLGARYDAASARAGRRRERAMLAGARGVLARQGLLRHLPVRRRRETLASFAVRLELLCGAAPHTVLGVRHRQIAARRALHRAHARDFCAINAAIASGHDPFLITLSLPSIDPPPLPVPTVATPPEIHP